MIEEQFRNIARKFENDYETNLRFQAAIYSAITLSTELSIKAMTDIEFIKYLKSHPDISESLFKYDKWKSFFKTNEEFDKTLIEKAFINKYQIFELLVFDLIFMLFKNFPNLIQDGESSTGITFDELYSVNDIDNLRDTVIESKTRQLIQFNTIKGVILQIEKKFGMKFSFTSDDLNNLFLISRLRNLIIHNNSVMNESVIKELKREKISIDIKLNQNIIPFLLSKVSIRSSTG